MIKKGPIRKAVIKKKNARCSGKREIRLQVDSQTEGALKTSRGFQKVGEGFPQIEEGFPEVGEGFPQMEKGFRRVLSTYEGCRKS